MKNNTDDHVTLLINSQLAEKKRPRGCGVGEQLAVSFGGRDSTSLIDTDASVAERHAADDRDGLAMRTALWGQGRSIIGLHPDGVGFFDAENDDAAAAVQVHYLGSKVRESEALVRKILA